MKAAEAHSVFQGTLAAAFQHALSHLEGLDRGPVDATADSATLRRRLARALTDDGLPPEQVVSELAEDVRGGLVGSAGGRFFGWVIGGSLPAALGADWLTSAWDQNATLHATSPAAALVEEVAGGWLKDSLGLPPQASFALVGGCQMAHMTCLAAARHALLSERGWDVERQGLCGAPKFRILTCNTVHGSFERAVRLVGLGTSSITRLPADADDRLSPAVLEQTLQADPAAPTIVLLQAGDVNIGAFDPLEALVPLAKRYGAWVHVDGAFGLWTAASPHYRHLVRGVEEADSWATDGHKWLNVPFDSGYAFVANAEAHRAAMSHRAPYLVFGGETREEMDWTPAWSRRARGFATYAALRQLGRRGIAHLVERCCRYAHAIVMGIGALSGAQVVREPVINQGLVRFLGRRPGATDEDHDRRTNEVIAAINSTGEAFFGGTTWRGRRAMRVSVSCWQTNEDDVQRVIRAASQVLSRLDCR
jgi:glutamate/tyrosine decarboxylase-like PLP-dependent enzyme